MTPDAQPVFCSLLRYFHHGDFASFRRVCDLTFKDVAGLSPFHAANLMLGAQLAGLIEIEDTDNGKVWWVAADNDVVVDSDLPKIVGVRSQWFRTNTDGVKRLIVDVNDEAILLGMLSPQGEPDASAPFGPSFWNRFPTFREIERDICEPEEFRIDLGRQTEAFSLCEAQWRIAELATLKKPHLVRARDRFGAISYFVIAPDWGLLYRIRHPDWAFIVAFNLLGWLRSDIWHEDSEFLSLPRTMRMPAPLLRYLFASASLVRLGPRVEFVNPSPSAREGLQSYFRT